MKTTIQSADIRRNPKCAGYRRPGHRAPFVFVTGNRALCAECHLLWLAAWQRLSEKRAA